MYVWVKSENYSDGLKFFHAGNSDGGWFPELESIDLVIGQVDATFLLHEMDLVSSAHRMINKKETAGTYSFMMPIAENMHFSFSEDTKDCDDNFRPECREVEFSIFGLTTKPMVRWSAMHKYSDDKVVSDWMTYEQIKEISEGRDPFAVAPPQAMPANPLVYSEIDMVNALIVWEWMNEHTVPTFGNPVNEEWRDLRGAIGSAEMRDMSVKIGRWCESVFLECESRKKDFNDCYAWDFEIVPLLMTFLEVEQASHGNFPPVGTSAERVLETIDAWENEYKVKHQSR